MDNRYQAYRQVEVNTTNRGKIVVMLFSGAITFLNKAKAHMLKKEFENKGKYIGKAIDIIEELRISLDLNKGKDIAKNLKSIYQFLDRYLQQANMDNDPIKIDRSIEILASLKDAFEEILKNPQNLEAQEFSKKEQVTNCIKKYA